MEKIKHTPGDWYASKWMPDPDARGWKPGKGWYKTLNILGYPKPDFRIRYATKRECEAAIAKAEAGAP